MHFRVVTPMFMAGANKNKSELRVQSLRGAMRWWFRALAGVYLDNHITVRGHENRLFGGTDEGEGAGALVFRIPPVAFRSKRYAMLPHKSGNQRSETDAIPPGTEFEILLKQSPYVNDPDAVSTGEAILNLASVLGGLGRRVRRGFGAYQPLSWQFSDRKEAICKIEEVLAEAQRSIIAYINTSRKLTGIDNIAPYPILHPNTSTIKVGEEETTDSFLAALMNIIHDRLEEHHPERLYKKVLGGGRPRQSSTLCVSVLGLINGDIVPVYTQFYCRTHDERRQRNDFNSMEKLIKEVAPKAVNVPI